jgi:hypothetical protein
MSHRRALERIRSIYNHPSSAMTVALTALVVAGSGGAYGAIGHTDPNKLPSRPPGPISACEAHKHGTLYIAAKCAPGDRRIQWNASAAAATR